MMLCCTPGYRLIAHRSAAWLTPAQQFPGVASMLRQSRAVAGGLACEAGLRQTPSLPAPLARAGSITPIITPASLLRKHTPGVHSRDIGRRCIASSSSSVSSELVGGDGGNNGAYNGNNGGGGGGGGGGDGKGEGSQDPAVTALLLAAGRVASSFPTDFAAGLTSGKVTVEILQRYLDMEGKFFIGWLMQFPGFRERLLADPGFLVKVAIEVGIGICTKMSAEYTKRQGHFMQELDFVTANVIMALIADFMLVWLPAPTLSYTRVAAGQMNWFAKMFAGCPDNAFQKVQPGTPPFTLAQRCGAPIRNGMKLFVVGLSASFFGVAITNTLLAVRQMLDPTFVPLNQPQDVLAMSAAYGVYMATSSNLRYQLLAGVIEERGIEVMLKGNYQACAVASFVVRTANTFLGSLLWVDFIRLLGMQKVTDH